MRSCLALTCIVLAVGCLSSTFGQPQQPVKSSESVWFALMEDLGGRRPYIVPIGTVTAGKIFPPPSGCEEKGPEFKKFETAYLGPLQSYSVTFGGAPAGVVVLLRPDPAFGGILVKYDGPARIHGSVMALATNARLSESEAPFGELRHRKNANLLFNSRMTVLRRVGCPRLCWKKRRSTT